MFVGQSNVARIKTKNLIIKKSESMMFTKIKLQIGELQIWDINIKPVQEFKYLEFFKNE